MPRRVISAVSHRNIVFIQLCKETARIYQSCAQSRVGYLLTSHTIFISVKELFGSIILQGADISFIVGEQYLSGGTRRIGGGGAGDWNNILHVHL